MDVTKIICDSDIRFDWYAILDAFKLTEKSKCTPWIYSIEGIADLAVSVSDEPGLCIHPGDSRTLAKVCEILSQAVSEYYNIAAEVSLCNDAQYFLQVKM